MGFFSWKCCGCNKPVINTYASGLDYPWTSQVVLLNADGSKYKGSYDGYGRVDAPGFDHNDNIADREFSQQGGVRWYHQRCYTGQTWAETAPAFSDPGQGYFYNDTDMQRIFGDPTGVST